MKGVIDVPSYEDLVVSGYARERHVLLEKVCNIGLPVIRDVLYVGTPLRNFPLLLATEFTVPVDIFLYQVLYPEPVCTPRGWSFLHPQPLQAFLSLAGELLEAGKEQGVR